MSIWERLFGKRQREAPTEPARPSLLVEVVADRTRLEAELVQMREQWSAGYAALARAFAENRSQEEAQSAETLQIIQALRSAVEAGQSQARQEAEDTRKEIGRLGREQFRTNTLADGQREAVQGLASVWQQNLADRERDREDARRLVETWGQEVKLGLIKDLLPVLDSLHESVALGEDLVHHAPQARPAAPRGLLGRLVGGKEEVGLVGSLVEHRAALQNWLEGMLMIERRLEGALGREGVDAIASAGQPFDPHLHVAVGMEGSDEVPDNTVLREQLRGYTLDGRVIRYAEVVVARSETGSQSEERGTDRPDAASN